MFGLIYAYYKLSPEEGGLTAVMFALCAAALIVGSLISSWILATQWRSLRAGDRARLIFYALFV